MDVTLKQRKDGVVGPKEIVTMLYKPNHSLFQVAFKAELSSGPPGNLMGVLNGAGIRILNSTVSSQDGKTGIWNIFLDSQDRSVTKAALIRRLTAIPSLRDIRVAGGDELVMDEFFFPLVMSTTGRRMMLVTQDSFQRMIAAMDSVLGSGAKVITFNEGSAMGSIYAGGLRTLIQGDVRRFIGELRKLYGATGIGIAEFVEMNLDDLHFVVRITDSIECQGKDSDEHISQWIRGHLMGAASSLLGVQMECIETKCIATGDPYCEFELSKSQGR